VASITFKPVGVEAPLGPVPADPDLAAEPGSILQRALAARVAMDHTCGGMAACATCHCYVVGGAATIPPPAADELAMLERAIDRRPDSRLACQAVPDGSADVVVELPPEHAE
jgi:2Fe-2S ferredoxin